jgi:excisionase family DNA binding protein
MKPETDRLLTTEDVAGRSDKQLYRIPETMTVLSLSRSVIYELIRSGRLRSVTQGRARLIPVSVIAEYVALLEDEARVA